MYNTTAKPVAPIKPDAGFTLVEVMVSMALVAIVFGSAFGAYFMGMRMVEDAREEVRASQIVQSGLETLRSKSWQEMEDMPYISLYTPSGNFIQKFSNNYLAYFIIEDLTSSQKRVSVWVRWKNRRGEYSYQIFSTLFSKGGLNDYYYRKV